MAHVVRSSFRVRSYEVDSYSHLNNGVYLSWFEQARLEYLESLGFSYDGFGERREWIVVRHIEVDFTRPLHVGDAVDVETRVESVGTTSVRFVQTMAPADGDPACTSRTVMVFSGPEGTAIPVPDDVRAAVASPERHTPPTRTE